jgi:hypothetical protein
MIVIPTDEILASPFKSKVLEAENTVLRHQLRELVVPALG